MDSVRRKEPDMRPFSPMTDLSCYFIPDSLANPSSRNFVFRALAIPRPPQATAEAKVVEFLTYHHEFVIHNHYFWHHDLGEFYKIGLLELSKAFAPMRYAVAAYPALTNVR
jgi:hypothetical protein